MFTVFQIAYTERTYKVGEFETLKEACAMERKLRKESDYYTFTSDGKKVVSNNGKIIR